MEPEKLIQTLLVPEKRVPNDILEEGGSNVVLVKATPVQDVLPTQPLKEGPDEADPFEVCGVRT